MPRRLARLVPVAALLGLSVVPLGGATATTKCPLITDRQGDANAPPAVSSGANFLFPNEPAYDILSADIASNRTTIDLVIRVLKLATTAPSSPQGIEWRFDFTANSHALFAEVVSDSGAWGRTPGVSAYIGYVDGSSHLIAPARATLDFKRNEVRLRIPISDFGSYAPRVGSKVTDLVATAGRWYTAPGASYSETDDTASTDNFYVLGLKTCIPA